MAEEDFGTLIVNFWGICTFMSNKVPSSGAPESIAWGSRYVLVDASNPQTIETNTHLTGLGITPHFAELQIATKDIVTASNTSMPGFGPSDFSIFRGATDQPFVVWRLDNVLLSVANAVPGPPTPTPNFTTLASQVAPGDTLGAPALYNTLHAVPTRPAAYFDFFSGNLECRRVPGGACVGSLTIHTLGNPQIRVHSFAFASDASILSVELKSFSQIAVGNGPISAEFDKNEDFRLHYLTCARFPEVDIHLEDCTCPELDTYNVPRWAQGLFVTPGCSNSTYP